MFDSEHELLKWAGIEWQSICWHFEYTVTVEEEYKGNKIKASEWVRHKNQFYSSKGTAFTFCMTVLHPV